MVCIFLDQEFLYYLNTVYTEFYFNENKLKGPALAKRLDRLGWFFLWTLMGGRENKDRIKMVNFFCSKFFIFFIFQGQRRAHQLVDNNRSQPLSSFPVKGCKLKKVTTYRFFSSLCKSTNIKLKIF